MLTSRASATLIQLYTATDNGPVRWRLLSSNNRELGRGTGEYGDPEACRFAVRQLQLVVADLQADLQPVLRPSRTAWSWQLVRHGEVVAVSGRSFDRHVRCTQSIDQFRARLAHADFTATVMVSQARRWRTAIS